MEKFNLYWEQVSQHIANLESKVGKVSHIFHELTALGGKDGLKIVEKLNPSCYQITRDKCQSGAVLETTENRELAEESMDWERCLLLGFLSQKMQRWSLDSMSKLCGICGFRRGRWLVLVFKALGWKRLSIRPSCACTIP